MCHCSRSEQKIDDIARSVDGIKHLLQGLNFPSGTKQLESTTPPSVVSQPEQGYNLHLRRRSRMELLGPHYRLRQKCRE